MKYVNFKLYFSLVSFLSSVGMYAQGSNREVVDSTLVNVAFRSVSKEDLNGDVSYLNVEELMKKNDMTNYGVSYSNLMPGLNGNIWGTNNLVLIDGMPRDMGNITASEIESITLLKGISAVALYGSAGSKGVMLVTTKRGIPRLNQFRVRANAGIYVPKSYPEYLGAAEYMSLYNEALRNDGKSELYSVEQIYNTADRHNPYRYPDVDYYSSDYLRNFTNRYDATAEFQGGNERARFYVNMGYYYTNTLLNVGAGKDENVSRFYVRGNLDLKINRFIDAKVNTSIVNYNTNTGKGSYWSNAASLRPNWYTPLIPIDYIEQDDAISGQTVTDSPFLIDGKYLLGGTQQQKTNPFAALYTQGLEKYTARQYQIDATLNFDLSSILKGLSFRTQLGVDYYSRYYLNENVNDYAIYEPIWNDYSGKEMISSLTKYNEDKVKRDRNLEKTYQYQKLLFTGVLSYNQVFDKVHNVTALVLANAYQQTISEAYHKNSNANLGFQATYNYRHKYYADFTGSLVHSAKLAPGHRNAFSPTGTIGWRISREDFMSGLGFIDDLKLTASAGLLHSDLDIGEYYMYKPIYKSGGTYQYRYGKKITATEMSRAEGSNIDFIQRKEINLGLETSLFGQMLRLKASWFRTKMEGMLIRNANAYPSYYSYSGTNMIPYENYDENEFSGVDFSVSANKKIGQVGLAMEFVGTYSVGKATKRSENLDYDYRTNVGRPISSLWGLVTDGFFMNEQEIAEAPTHTFETVKPGDIRYVDQNNDDKIDATDAVYLGRKSAPFIFGLNLTAKWKDFTLFMLWSGQMGGHDMKSNDYYRPRGEKKYSYIARERTTIKQNENGEWVVDKLGTFPRLTTGNGSNNFRDSDYWMYKTDYLSLSQIQLSYNLPAELCQRTFLKEIGVYVNASNLLTISKARKIMETKIGSTPDNRFFNLGVKVAF